MRLNRTILMIGLIGGLAPLASAQVKLERKYAEGSSQSVETSVRLEQKLTIAGMDIDTSQNTRTTVKLTNGKRDDAGQLRSQQTIESLQITTNVMGQEYNFDSTSPDTPGTSVLEGLRPLHKALLRRTTTMVYDKNNSVAGIETDQDVLNDVPEQIRAAAKDQLDTENLKQAANQELKRLPSEPVKKGDTWERTEKLRLGAGQVMTFVSTYTYEGEIDRSGRKLDRITSRTTAVDYAVDDPNAQFQVKSSALKPADSKGEILFDRAAGQVVESSESLEIVGDITLAVNNMELPAKLDLKIETTTKQKD